MMDFALLAGRPLKGTRRSHRSWVSRLESLEGRIVLSNGLVGVPGRFSPPLHLFNVTEVVNDADNDGLVNTQNLTIVGNAENASLSGDFASHGSVRIDALLDGGVVGSAVLGTSTLVVDSSATYRGLFNFPVTLKPTTGVVQNITFRVTVGSYGSLEVFQVNAPAQRLTGTFTIEAPPDTTPPTAVAFSPIATPRTIPLSSVDLSFSEAIAAGSFTTDDLELTLGGNPVSLAGVAISQLDPSNFRIAGLSTATTPVGDYVLRVDATGIEDLAGNMGTGSLATNFTVQSPDTDTEGPTIVTLSAPTSPRVEPVQSVEVTFSELIAESSFTVADVSLTRDGQPVALGAEASVARLTDTTYRIAGLNAATTPTGSYVLKVDATGIEDLVGNPGVGSESVSFVVQEPIVSPGPQVLDLVRYGYHNQPTVLVLSFDSELDTTTAQNLKNYRVYSPGRDKKLGTLDDVAVTVALATYDATTQTVTLVTSRRLSLFQTHRIVVRGTGPNAVSDTEGNLLDGNADGTAGGDYVEIFGRNILLGPASNAGITSLPNGQVLSRTMTLVRQLQGSQVLVLPSPASTIVGPGSVAGSWKAKGRGRYRHFEVTL